jgi:hypothetical protein
MAQRLTTDPGRETTSTPTAAATARRRQRLAVAASILVVAVVAGGVIGWRAWVSVNGPGDASGRERTAAGARPSPSGPGLAIATGGPAEIAPVRGAGTFTFVTSGSAVRGTGGTLKRYRVAVENGANQDGNAFAGTVDATLADPRGWIGGGDHKFQRVNSTTADFVVYLATPATSEAMCATGGLHTDQYTSCRLPGKLIINLARWLAGVPDYGAPLTTYRAYAINHELGHELGNGHEACPGKGSLAPVMQQQTLGLGGCTANAWPYVAGQRYSGPDVP